MYLFLNTKDYQALIRQRNRSMQSNMELDLNLYLFQQANLDKIQAVNIRPSQYVFKVNICQVGDQNCHLLSVISSKQPNKVTKIVFEKVSSSCRFISSIDLSGMYVNDTSMMMIKKCAFLFITAIDISNNCLTDVGAKCIYECGWKYLKKINLADNPIKNKGMSYVCKSYWPFLDFVNLKNTMINDDGARCLTKAQWPNLNIIILSGNTFTNSTFKDIIICNFPNITGVHIEDYNEESNTFFNHNLVAKATSGEIAYIAKYTYMPRSFFKVIRHKTDYQFLQPFDELSSDDEI